MFRKVSFAFYAAVALLFGTPCLGTDDKTSDKEFMPEWQKGYLDIHTVATVKGDCSFVMMPDGTTMLIDAGEVGPNWPLPQPNPSKTAAEWIVKYIRDFAKRDTVDYLYITHLHGDHIGVEAQVVGHAHGYGLCGVTRVGEDIHFNRIIDRACPDYAEPISDEPFVKDYIKYALYQRDSCGTKLEQFQIGSKKQIALQYDRKSFRKDFEVYNLAANGYVYNGKGKGTTYMYPVPPTKHDENMYSCVFLMRYGDFTYYNGGDLGGGPGVSNKYRDGEKWVADLIGQHVTMIKPDHHGYAESSNGYFLKVLSPELIVIPSSHVIHPHYKALSRLTDEMSYVGPRQIYVTNDGCKERIENNAPGLWDKVIQYHGHVVVRVYEGGTSYQVFVLDNVIPDYHVLYKSDIIEIKK